LIIISETAYGSGSHNNATVHGVLLILTAIAGVALLINLKAMFQGFSEMASWKSATAAESSSVYAED
jgi:hypothetical protein